MIAMSKDGEDAIWVWGDPGKIDTPAVIAPKKPSDQEGSRKLLALMAHLNQSEWHWFEPK